MPQEKKNNIIHGNWYPYTYVYILYNQNTRRLLIWLLSFFFFFLLSSLHIYQVGQVKIDAKNANILFSTCVQRFRARVNTNFIKCIRKKKNTNEKGWERKILSFAIYSICSSNACLWVLASAICVRFKCNNSFARLIITEKLKAIAKRKHACVGTVNVVEFNIFRCMCI